MGISVDRREYDFNLTAIAGGATVGFLAKEAAVGFAQSATGQAVSDAAGAEIGGKLKHMPKLAGAWMGSYYARTKGASDTAAASHVAGKVTEQAPAAGEALEKVAEHGDSAAVRGAAKLGGAAPRLPVRSVRSVARGWRKLGTSKVLHSGGRRGGARGLGDRTVRPGRPRRLLHRQRHRRRRQVTFRTNRISRGT